MNKDLNFQPLGRWLLSLMGGWGLFVFVTSHRLVLRFQKGNFFPGTFEWNYWLFEAGVSIFCATYVFLTQKLLGHSETCLRRKFNKHHDALNTLGMDSVRNGIVFSGVLFLYGTVLVLADYSLFNVWDILFLIIFIGFYYVGVYLHFYYCVPLELWEAIDPKVELEKLKIEYDEQRMYLRTFLWIIVSFLVSQVFVILKTKFEPYLQDPDRYSYLQPVMVINALEISFLIISVWALVLSRLLRRMEEVKFKMMTLEIPK